MMTPNKIAQARAMYDGGKQTLQEIADTFGVFRLTVYRDLTGPQSRRCRAHADASAGQAPRRRAPCTPGPTCASAIRHTEVRRKSSRWAAREPPSSGDLDPNAATIASTHRYTLNCQEPGCRQALTCDVGTVTLPAMGNRFPPKTVRATITDVADAAGVSKATVSKYLAPDKNYYIAGETRERIAAAIRGLEFSPNAMARGLSIRQSNAIGVIVASITNPFYPELIAGVEEAVEGSDYTLLLGSTVEEPANEGDIVRSMMQRQVEGLVMAAVTMDDSEVARLAQQGVDVVLASRGLRTTLVDTVEIDNESGGRLAMEHLLGHGHTRIAHLTGSLEVLPFQRRLDGARAALTKAGHPIAEQFVVEAERRPDGVAEAMDALFERPEPPTALFVGSDRMAIEALEWCASYDVSVPGDLAVIGFDNIWVGRLQGVDLTTIDSKAREVGRQAAALLTERIQARRDGEAASREPKRVVMPAELLVRRSCGCSKRSSSTLQDEEPDTSSLFLTNRETGFLLDNSPHSVRPVITFQRGSRYAVH